MAAGQDVIKELGLEHLTQEEKDQVLVQLTDSLLKRLILRVYDKLAPEGQKEFDALAESGDGEKINDFLRKKVPDLDEIRDEELEGLKAELADFLAAVKK